jgi:hypothetical protein
VVGEDHRPVRGEDAVDLAVREPVRVLALVLQPHDVDDVDQPHLEVGQVPAQQVGRGHGLQRRHVTRAAEHDIGLVAVAAARPVPDAQSARAVGDGLIHGQPLWAGVLPRDDDVDVVPRAQAVVEGGEQRVRVGGQVGADDLGLLVEDMVDEPRSWWENPLWSWRQTWLLSR